jgi:UDP-GlcNAc:undecaprenyl-phosphate GlcNAc-1-phosphate transferase
MAERLGLLDRPGHRKVHSVPIPLGGGLGIWFSVVTVFAIGTLCVYILPKDASWLPSLLREHQSGLQTQTASIWGLLLGGTILMFLGLADDRRGLPWQLRLVVEFGVAAAVVYWQGLQLTAFIDSPLLTGILSVFWIVLLVNSFNMLDNMDGLSSGVAMIACTMLGIMLLSRPESQSQASQLFVATMLFVLAGGLLGFLFHNWPPAKIFMGDAGSYFVGYWIAVSTLLATYTDYRGSTQHAVLAPLCILAVPLYDTFSVIWIRLRSGRSPFEGDKKHFSHRLVELGFSKKSAVLTIYLATLACSLGSLLLPRTDLIGAGIVILIVACLLGLIGLLEYRAWRDNTRNPS